MTEKIYVVTLHKHEDLDSFYTEMTDKGFRLNMKRPISRNTHYWMTEEQAIELRKDSRVWDVQLPPEERGIVLERSANYNPYPVAGNFWKGDTQGSPTVSVTDRQWGHLHCAGDTAQRRKGTYGLINQGATDEQVIDTVTVFNDGEHVDVIICDDPVSTDNEEWYSPTTNTTRYVQYDWYTELNTLVSTIDDDGQATPPSTYPNYFKNDTNTESHGNHVCGTVAGQYYGWAREANIYSLQVLGNVSNTGTPVPSLLIFDYLRAFHRSKAINPETGHRNPTITNHSWGAGYDLTSENLLNHAAPIAIGEISSITYGGITYSSINPNPSGWTMAGVEADFGIGANKMKIPADIASYRADTEDAIADGVVIIGATGNQNFHMVPDTDPNWDNFIKFNALSGNIFFNRGSSPVNAKNVVKVGALSNHHNFLRATYSNFGPAVDVFAPGNNILSAYDNTGLNDTKYTQGTGNYFYPIQGTSMASPQVAGVAACLATGKFRFTNADVLGYIQDHCVTGDMNWNTNGGDFADNTCQADSPDRYLAAINPRPESGQLIEQTGNRNTGMVFPRTRVSSTTADNPAGGQTYTLTITVVGAQNNNYTVVGSDRNGSVSGLDPILEFNEGDTVYFNVNAPGHPVWLKDTAGTGANSGNYGTLDSSVTNNGTDNGTIIWNISVGLAGGGSGPNGYFYYQCQNHVSMVSTIQVNPSAPTGEQGYYVAGTYTWVCPAGVSSVSAVCIGGGGSNDGSNWSGGGGGGGLGWKNNISVVEGQSYTVVVGAAGVPGVYNGINTPADPGTDGGTSYFIGTGTVSGGGGVTHYSNAVTGENAPGGTWTGDGGGNGGRGGAKSPPPGGPGYYGGGGGAGGYSGNGGDGGTNVAEWSVQVSAGTGGAAGGGWAIQGEVDTAAGCGGGVGVEGEGASGAAGTGVHDDTIQSQSDNAMGGRGGSGGTNGSHNTAGTYGGGADGGGTAAKGAVRIIWGNGRSFPNNAA